MNKCNSLRDFKNQASIQQSNDGYKFSILQSISDLYTDLEKNRVPVLINVDSGKVVESRFTSNSTKTVLIHPISFAIPEELLEDVLPPKQKNFGQVIPGDTTTYFHYTNESQYYDDMRKSLFVLTYKKGGWDCLRHYEILATGSLPVFLHIKHCPSQSLTLHPKKLYQLILKQPGLEVAASRTGN